MVSAPLHRSSLESGSFRDRHARVYLSGDAVYRGMSAHALQQWQRLASQPFFREFTQRRALVGTAAAEPDRLPSDLLDSDWPGFLEHERIPVVSYPYEWSFSMLQDAAVLHLDLLEAAVRAGMTMKDGSAYNVQWRGVQPVFIDISSFEEQPPHSPWTGYRQFCQQFLFPLMLHAYRDVPFHAWLRGQLDGIDADQLWSLLSVRDLLRKGVFTHVFLHAKLQRAYGNTTRNLKAELKSAGFRQELILANIAGLRKTISRLRLRSRDSNWTSYADDNSYSDPDRATKHAFVRHVVQEQRPSTAWDLGCNTGEFAQIAARYADYVVAFDSDHACIDRFYLRLRAEGPSNILPLIGDVVDPSPGLGWMLAERRPLVQRSRPDLILCLALIHHLVIGANVPLRELIEWLASLGSDLVIEFVDKSDPMVQTLLRNKSDAYDDYELSLFDRWMRESFDVAQTKTLSSGTRTLYHAKART